MQISHLPVHIKLDSFLNLHYYVQKRFHLLSPLGKKGKVVPVLNELGTTP
jgi:hypothetical protein